MPTATVMHDRDANYRKVFGETLHAASIEPMLDQFRSPNLQAHVERFIQSLQQECSDHIIGCGERHLGIPGRQSRNPTSTSLDERQ